MSLLVTTICDPKFLAGLLAGLLLWGIVSLVRCSRTISLKPGTLAYEVQIDVCFRQTWMVGYATLAEVPIQVCDCGRTVRYAGKLYRIESLYGGSGIPTLKSLR